MLGRMDALADRYHRNATGFTNRVEAVADDAWSSPSPCSGWTARDVVRHVVESSIMFLGRVDAAPDDPTSVDDDPLAAWHEAREAMESALADPDVAGREYDGGFGPMVFANSVDQFMSTDLTVHTWDLARATDGDDRLDSDECALVLDRARTMEQRYGDAMRGAGGFGPPIEIAADAPVQERMLAFLGRDPSWRTER
jgi:uncharacterized protein (TIGR03086 family)